MSVVVWIGVGLLGGLGALGRFLIDGAVAARLGNGLPWGTFVVNVSGAFALGLVTGLALKGDALLLAGTAALGSYTTFSTWMLETHRLSEDGEPAAAVANVLGSVVAGVAAAALGRALA